MTQPDAKAPMKHAQPSVGSIAAHRPHAIAATTSDLEPDLDSDLDHFEDADDTELPLGRFPELGYPLVLKPVDLCAGMFVRRVDDERQLAEAHRALAGFPVNARGQRREPAVLLEELLDGPEVSVETVSYGGRTRVVGVTDKSIGGAPAFIETGHMFPAALDAEQAAEARETAVRAVAALGLDEVVAHTEIKLTRRGPRVVEVNPRRPGTGSPSWSAM